VYRFWRDLGLVAGALAAGAIADSAGTGVAIVAVAALTAASGVWVLLVRRHWESRYLPSATSSSARETSLVRSAERRPSRWQSKSRSTSRN
jgi:hypothetical protein